MSSPLEPAVKVTGLGKTYRIGRSGPKPTTAVEAAIAKVRNPVRRGTFEHFDALDDVSFEIPWGEAVGIIGRNGAGKSTLLKLLTRITAPTRGRIEIGGRIGSLLEVGTGFHAELTGRENVYLNGALLGMTRNEIRRRFDEIVDFSGIAQFLDTPVKRYSSGMYVRLAFAVAAHLETEILAIDEVLAVGDAEFQRKSLAKMRDVAREGRTVLYVSHQVSTVTALCTSALFLERGRLSFQGGVDDALRAYRDSFETFAAAQSDPAARSGSGELRFESVSVEAPYVTSAEDKTVNFAVGANPDVPGQYYVSCHVNDINGAVIAQCDSRLVGLWLDPSEPRRGQITIKDLWLKPGRYTVDMFVCKSGVLDAWDGAGQFEVLPEPPYAEGADADATSQGVVFADFSYEAW